MLGKGKHMTIFLGRMRESKRAVISIRRTLELFRRQCWRNFWETGWSAYKLFWGHRHHLELNWTVFHNSCVCVAVPCKSAVCCCVCCCRRLCQQNCCPTCPVSKGSWTRTCAEYTTSWRACWPSLSTSESYRPVLLLLLVVSCAQNVCWVGSSFTRWHQLCHNHNQLVLQVGHTTLVDNSNAL